jgi:hypothetical protein
MTPEKERSVRFKPESFPYLYEVACEIRKSLFEVYEDWKNFPPFQEFPEEKRVVDELDDLKSVIKLFSYEMMLCGNSDHYAIINKYYDPIATEVSLVMHLVGESLQTQPSSLVVKSLKELGVCLVDFTQCRSCANRFAGPEKEQVLDAQTTS